MVRMNFNIGLKKVAENLYMYVCTLHFIQRAGLWNKCWESYTSDSAASWRKHILYVKCVEYDRAGYDRFIMEEEKEAIGSRADPSRADSLDYSPTTTATTS